MPITKLRPEFTFTQDRVDALRAIAPEAFADGKINRDALLEALGEYLEEDNQDAEHFGLFWPGKRQARRLASQPSAGALRPAPGEGVNEETTRHIFIEGDNLQVLKLLQKSYAGRVKMIYIDPPYNTGNDFIYSDNFTQPVEEYLRATGQADEMGRVLVTNTQAGGRYHSNWLNMMYPRLRLARNLLSADGVILISIDDNELHNLRGLIGEVFGEENLIGICVWQKSRKGDAKLLATIHEYIVIAAKDKATLTETMVWRLKKPGVDEVLHHYQFLRSQWPDNHTAIAEAMREWYKSLPQGDPRRSHEHYRWSDDRGLYFAADFAGPDDGRKSRPRYDITHPVTGMVCKKPSTGWRWDEERTKRALAANPPLIHFGPDETTIPCRKSYLKDVDTEPLASVFYRDGRAGTLEVEALVGKGMFDFPKDIDTLRRLVDIMTEDDSVVLDFFAGSCTTAQAILEVNRQGDGNRRFIMVQLPEPTDADSPARNAGYDSIAEIGKERIRRVIQRMQAKDAGKWTTGRDMLEDLGFRVFKLDRSHYRAWRDFEGGDIADLQTLFDRFESPLVEGWRPEDVLVEIMLMEGFPLDSTNEVLPEFARNTVTRVSSDLVAHRLFVCLDKKVHDETIAALALGEEDIFICLDSALSDEAKVQLEDGRRVKVI